MIGHTLAGRRLKKGRAPGKISHVSRVLITPYHYLWRFCWLTRSILWIILPGARDTVILACAFATNQADSCEDSLGASSSDYVTPYTHVNRWGSHPKSTPFPPPSTSTQFYENRSLALQGSCCCGKAWRGHFTDLTPTAKLLSSHFLLAPRRRQGVHKFEPPGSQVFQTGCSQLSTTA